MKKVVKVSIGHFAFTLEDEAFRKIDSYLNELKAHYSGNENSAEIIDGIEERMAELIIERCPDGRIVPPEVADSVINILGRPDVIGEESGERSKERYSSGRSVIKKLYRDPDNKIFGGVCSGIAAYFNTDPTPIRLLFILLLVILSVVPFRVVGGAFMVVVYIVLWIVIPRAKTVEQRCEMRGEEPTISNIEKNIEEAAATLGSRIDDVTKETQGFWKVLERVFSMIFGLIFTLIGIFGIIVAVVSFTGLQMFNSNINDFLFFFIDMNRSTTILFKIVSAIAIVLPFIGLLYGGIKLLFRFKSPRWRPGLVMFIIWVLSVCSSVTIAIISSSPYWNTQDQAKTEIYSSQSDTLYIKLNDLGRWKDGYSRIDATPSRYEVLYVDKRSDNDLRVIVYPEIILRRDYENDDQKSGVIEVKSCTTLFTDMHSFDQIKKAAEMSYYSFSGDTLYVDPIVYSKYNKMKEVDRDLYIYIPENKVVIVEEPIYHQFQGRFNYNNMRKFNRWFRID